jgi:hypothetical protein
MAVPKVALCLDDARSRTSVHAVEQVAGKQHLFSCCESSVELEADCCTNSTFCPWRERLPVRQTLFFDSGINFPG